MLDFICVRFVWAACKTFCRIQCICHERLCGKVSKAAEAVLTPNSVELNPQLSVPWPRHSCIHIAEWLQDALRKAQAVEDVMQYQEVA